MTSAELHRTAIEVAVARLTGDRDAVAAATAVLSGDERARATGFAFDRDRTRFILARAQLRRLLATRLGTRPESVRLVYGPNGKPAIAPGSADPEVHFNVSHCEDLAVYALSIECEVGVDVEAVRALPDADAVAERCFSHREREAYRALAPQERPLGFFNCWTRKEAFLKALGDGLGYPLDQVDVSLTPGEPARILRVAGTPGAECGWSMESFAPRPGFVAALVAAIR